WPLFPRLLSAIEQRAPGRRHSDVARSLSPPVLLGFFRLFADVPAALDRGIARPHRALHGPSFQLGLRLLHLALPIAVGFASDANAVDSRPPRHGRAPLGAQPPVGRQTDGIPVTEFRDAERASLQ